jgi:hypothetical protein
MTRVLVKNPIEIWEGPSDPEPIQIEETIRSDNPEVSMPQIGLPGDVSAQPGIARTSERESAPNPLHELITIYDDEESSEVFLVTLVGITEEKEPEKVYFLAPNAPIPILAQNDHEVESVLDTELLDTPGTQVDSPKDGPGSGKQEG